MRKKKKKKKKKPFSKLFVGCTLVVLLEIASPAEKGANEWKVDFFLLYACRFPLHFLAKKKTPKKQQCGKRGTSGLESMKRLKKLRDKHRTLYILDFYPNRYQQSREEENKKEEKASRKSGACPWIGEQREEFENHQMCMERRVKRECMTWKR